MTLKKEDIRCPTCNKENTWKADNAYRPFCSARCKLIDLGEWADENHVIPGEPVNPRADDDIDET
ncbi:MAG: DNA gyrase inhibitor YacG [Gammaproteobacteria bacterium]|nr:DNA gyrase inhibitor YacG [Gammaproteobacteria bacterium]